jgi:hypothetical protein
MGGTSSTNIVRDTTNTLIESANTAASESTISQMCVNSTILKNCKNISNINIDQEMNCIVNQQNMVDVTQDAAAAVTDDKTVTQLAETIAQNLDLNPGTKESTNITELVSNLAIAVRNTVTSSCIIASDNANSFVCEGSENLWNINVKQTASSGLYSNCVLKATQVTKAQADLKQAIDQTAKTTVKNTIAAILLAAAVLAIAVAIAYAVVRSGGGGLGGGGGAGSKIKMILIFLAVMLLIFTYLYNECNGNISKIPLIGGLFPHWCKTQKTTIITYIVFGAIMLLFIYLVFVRPAMSKTAPAPAPAPAPTTAN